MCVISNQSTGKIHINVSDPPTERSVGVRVGGDREVGEGVGQNLKRVGVNDIGGEGVLQKVGGLAPLCQLCKETFKNSHPPFLASPCF